MQHRHIAAARAFTLIELLVVIGIIGVLVGLVLAVGQAVVNGAKHQSTQDTLSILDSALSAYIDENDGLPPVFVELDPLPGSPAGTPPDIWPMADVRDMAYSMPAPTVPGRRQGNQLVNSTGLFLYEASKYPRVKAIIDKLPARVVVRQDVDSNPGSPPDSTQRELQTVVDSWGRPIRFVHPSLDGRVEGNTPAAVVDINTLRIDRTRASDSLTDSIRRNRIDANANPVLAEEFADSDGGRCVGNRPYFYSAGADGRVGWSSGSYVDYNADNLYSTKPVLPAKP